MTNRTSPVRRHTRCPVNWPVLYREDEFLAEGTVLDLTQIGWRVAGPMPVTPGTELAFVVWVPDKTEPLRIERATVLWVNGCEFAIEARQMVPSDHMWVTEFLNRKVGLSWVSRACNGQPHRPSIKPAFWPSSLPQAQIPALQDLIQWLLGAQPDMKPFDVEVNQREILGSRGREAEEYRLASDRWFHEIWYPALHIVRGMRAKKPAVH
jgi:hypothetical protein